MLAGKSILTFVVVLSVKFLPGLDWGWGWGEATDGVK